jgi:hypothetical protein
MYLDESQVDEPPDGGRPDINANTVGGLGKTNIVIDLLRHLSYIHYDNCKPHGLIGSSLSFGDVKNH